MATERPKLTSLSSRLAQKTSQTVRDEREPTPAAEPKPKKDDRVQILVRVDPAIRKKLKLIAVELEISIQDLCAQAIQDIVDRNGR